MHAWKLRNFLIIREKILDDFDVQSLTDWFSCRRCHPEDNNTVC